MKVLLVNKFLYPKGGSETYVFKLGKILENQGHHVEYFGLYNLENIVGNSANAYIESQDFQKGIKANLTAPLKIIYSVEAKKKIRLVLEKFNPDIVHMNNIQFHITPSIIKEINKYGLKKDKKIKIIYTAHDFQLVCPSHGLFDNNLKSCEKCLDGNYLNCLLKKCVKNSRLKSGLAMLDAYFWKYNKAYTYINTIICPSKFMKNKLDTQKRFKEKTIAIHNFVDLVEFTETTKDDYVLEFGKLCKEKGTYTLLEVCKRMPNIKFIFAGYGPAIDEINKLENAEFVGFKNGKELEMIIRKALVSVSPSECHENCSFSVIESQMYMTPVLGARMGGTPELIKEGLTGELFEAGNVDDLENKLKIMIASKEKAHEYSHNCKYMELETPETYYQKLINIYNGE